MPQKVLHIMASLSPVAFENKGRLDFLNQPFHLRGMYMRVLHQIVFTRTHISVSPCHLLFPCYQTQI